MGPRVPTWLLALLVVGALGGAGWLFWSERGADDASRDAPAEEASDESNDVLSLPDEDAADDDGSGRRGDAGRDRLGDRDGDGIADDPDADDARDDLPAAFASLRGRRVALVPAAASGSGDVTRLVQVGDLRVPCATPGAAGVLEQEVAALGASSELLARAGATRTGSAAASTSGATDAASATGAARADDLGATSCVDARVRSFDDADVAVVLRVDPKATAPRVLAGRPSARGTDADSATLAAEVAAALDVDATTATSAATRSLLARAGAIDAADGAAVVLIELPASRVADDARRDAAATDLVGALAAFLSRADQAPADETPADETSN